MKQAAAVAPLNDDLSRRLAGLCISAGDHRYALNVLDALAAASPLTVHDALARTECLIALQDYYRAEDELRALLDAAPRSVRVVRAWCQFLIDVRGAPDEAVAVLSSFDSSEADRATEVALAKALVAASREEEAVVLLERVIRREPANASAWLELGIAERRRGNISRAGVAFRCAAESDPENPGILRMEGSEHRYQYGDAAFKRVSLALARSRRMAKTGLVDLNYAAGKAYEDVGDLATAFAHYARAGALQREIAPWSPSEARKLLGHLKRYVTKEYLIEARKLGHASSLPIFVFGMPRSGTTLVEQVISSHPGGEGAGELSLAAEILDGVQIGGKTIRTLPMGKTSRIATPKHLGGRGRAYTSELNKFANPGTLRVVDKMPGNYAWLGLLDAALPNCFLIHCRRHPVDTCLSMYKLYFGDKIPYSYDLRDLGRAYRLYFEYMHHWSETLPPGRIHHIRYEDLVLDFETQARALIKHVGLGWDERCFEFHQTRRTVRTASASQARQPLYENSIGRWRTVKEHLVPLIEELGDVVEAYEKENLQVSIRRPASSSMPLERLAGAHEEV